MAGKFRRKFVDIISDKIIDHYQGKVADGVLSETLESMRKLIVKLEHSKMNGKAERDEQLRKLKRLPLEKLKELLAAQA